MYNPQTISFSNLFSHKQTEFNFENGVITLIHGENADVKGSNSNGGGKSTIMEAIYIALHGECYRDVDKLHFINKEADSCHILFTLFNPVLNEELSIMRSFHRKKGSAIKIHVNNELQSQLTSVAEANQFVFNRLGISKEDMGNHYVISQGNNSSFFSSTDTRQKEIIGRFANFAAVDKVLEDVRKRIKESDKGIQATEGEIMGKEAVLDNLQQMLGQATQQQDERLATHKQLILEHQEAIDTRKATLAEKRNEEAEWGKELDVVRGKLTTLLAEQQPLLVYAQEVETHERILEGYYSDQQSLRKSLSRINVVLAGSVTCPKCDNEFIPEGDIASTQKLLADTQKTLEGLDGKITKRRAKLQNSQKQVAQLDKVEENIDLLRRNERRLVRDLDQSYGESKKVHRKIKEAEHELARLKANPPLKTKGDKGNTVKEQLTATKVQLEELKAALSTLLTAKHDLQYWELHFGTKGFKTYLANQTIGVIEQLVNHSLGKLYTDLQVSLKGYTTLKNGDLRDKITIGVIGPDGDTGPFERHSGGEKARVKVAGILALHQLSNINTDGRGLNLLCLDENFEGLDSQGYQEVLPLIAAHKVTTLIITHHKPEFLPSQYNRVVVRKQAGFSTLLPYEASSLSTGQQGEIKKSKPHPRKE